MLSLGPTCDLCHDNNWLLVLATGRSGSTSVMSMLNALPNTYIAGENYDMAGGLFDLFMKAKTSEHMGVGKDKRGAWAHRHVDEHTLLCDLQNYARDAIGATQTAGTIGWKEIRYQSKSLPFLRQLFPCAKYIVIVRRKLENQSRSAWFKTLRRSHQQKVSLLKEKTQLLVEWGEKHHNSSVLLHTEDMTVERFNAIARWLGHTCHFNHVSHANINGGYNPDSSAECR